MPLLLVQRLLLDNCPFCGIKRPYLALKYNFETTNRHGIFKRKWGVYACRDCGGLVTASALKLGGEVYEVYPSKQYLSKVVPPKVKELLAQALDSLSTPAGSAMLSAAAVDIMLKKKKYTKGSLYDRIDKVAEDHIIPPEMAAWARDIRLDPLDQPVDGDEEFDGLPMLGKDGAMWGDVENDSEAEDDQPTDEEVENNPLKSHSHEIEELPSKDRAEKGLEFAKTLVQYLFVLPDRVKRGVRDAKRSD